MRFSLLLATLMLGLLTGCSTVIDSTTSEPISDNRGSRTAGQFIDDETAEIAIAVNLKKASPELKVSNINVKVYNGVVLVAGQVPSEDARQIAEKVATQHRGVVRVINQLEIAGKATIISEIIVALPAISSWLITRTTPRCCAVTFSAICRASSDGTCPATKTTPL